MSLNIKAGEYRHRITILEASEAADSSHAQVPTWEVMTIVWAAVIPANGTEYLAADQLTPQITHQVKTRYISGLDETMKIIFENTRTLEIVNILDTDTRHREIILECHEVKEKPTATKYVASGGMLVG